MPPRRRPPPSTAPAATASCARWTTAPARRSPPWPDIDWLAADPANITWDETEVAAAPTLMEEGPYYYRDAGVADAYTYGVQTVNLAAPTVTHTDHWEESTWY